MLGRKLKTLLLSTTGAMAATFGFMLPLIIGSAGMAVDLSKAYLVKNRMCQALDTATLAVGSSHGSQAELEERLEKFITANHPDEELGDIFNVVLMQNANVMTAEASAKVPASFMGFFGQDEMEVWCTTEVVREVRGLEVAMVVDVTGSMSTNNNIEALRTASENFVNILFDRTTDPEAVKIGIVPYVSTVNVGPYGLGLDEDGLYYDDPFVNNPSGRDFDQSDSEAWHGCVMALDNPEDTQNGDATWSWEMFNHDFSGSYYSDWRNYAWYYNDYYGPNYNCNRNYIQPLTSDRDQLIDKIELFYPDGYTHGNLGMVWGYRIISPEFPFREAAGWEDDEWQKAVLMMTDGANTVPPSYGAYGSYYDYANDGISSSEQNERFETVCNALKQQGVLVYTVTFTSSVNSTTRGYYERCATDSTKYFNAPDQADLVDAFERISTELSNLHISK